ncbi:hypothetical protein J2S00_001733 [Caldalkalibacillus uzonensis]|uniref:Uncharacterized protein n=1 Tax=Caldalkalibacillus uzonensis TaxID=353224 RepID=A0ABU0CR98_9BACI|nr:hypothetical protein [Caldalkalibacillus uzonensis]MDQ0338947.1 hypothetical protein [Caldalkalibacillus uzonensis]
MYPYWSHVSHAHIYTPSWPAGDDLTHPLEWGMVYHPSINPVSPHPLFPHPVIPVHPVPFPAYPYTMFRSE